MPKKKQQTDRTKLPVYEIVIDPDDITTGVKMVSLLSDPAIEIQGQYFKKPRKWGLVTPPCHFSNPPENTEPNCNCDIVYNPLIGDHEWLLGDSPCDFCLAQKAKWDSLNVGFKNQKFSGDKEQKIIAGPVLIPNKKIYRKDDDTGAEYYVVFSPEVIHQIVEKFNRGNNNRSINVDHTNLKAPAFIKENWTVADSTYDKSKVYGYDLEPSSWFWLVKVEDDAFWEQQVKTEGKYSFSIEGMLGQKLMDFALGKVLNTHEMLKKLELKELLDFGNEILSKLKG